MARTSYHCSCGHVKSLHSSHKHRCKVETCTCTLYEFSRVVTPKDLRAARELEQKQEKPKKKYHRESNKIPKQSIPSMRAVDNKTALRDFIVNRLRQWVEAFGGSIDPRNRGWVLKELVNEVPSRLRGRFLLTEAHVDIIGVKSGIWPPLSVGGKDLEVPISAREEEEKLEEARQLMGSVETTD